MKPTLQGIAASDGIAIAKVYTLTEPDLTVTKVTVEDSEKEVSRLDDALAASIKDVELIKETALKNLGEEEAQVFDAHLMVLSDPELIGQVKDSITSNKVNAESALKEVTDMFISIFAGMEDNPYMQERAADIRDVSKRVLAHLLGVKIPSPATIKDEVIIVAADLTPSDTAQLNRQYVKAFVTDIGGRTSHSAIMARSLEIPAIVGTKEVTSTAKDGDIIIVDGLTGDVFLNPSEEVIAEYRAKAEAFAAQKAEWEKLKDSKTYTKDGHQVELAANIGTPKDLEGVVNNGAEGVGLYRTEFLYMDSDHFPTEDEQFEAYKQVLEGMQGKKVVVRTLDIGGDKHLSYYEFPQEMNPFLGYRAIRLCLKETDIFKTQLRALCRASVYGRLCIMFPMIATVKEFRDAKAIFEEVKAELVAEGVAVSDSIEVGMMVEIPAAAVLADQFAKYADFFSIGTNDLIQYSMAADRMSEHVSYLYQPYNPSVLRLVANTIKGAHEHGKWVGMCGAMAGEPHAVPILLGLGLDEFSMSATQILKARKVVKSLSYEEMQGLAQECLNKDTADEVLETVKTKLGE